MTAANVITAAQVQTILKKLTAKMEGRGLSLVESTDFACRWVLENMTFCSRYCFITDTWDVWDADLSDCNDYDWDDD